MRQFPKKFLSFSIAVLLMTGCVSAAFCGPRTAVSAASVQEKLNQAKKNKKAAQAGKAQSKEKLTSAMDQVKRLDGEVEEIHEELAEIDRMIRDAETKIAEKEAEIADYEQKIAENDKDFCARLRALDESNAASYIDLLLNAQSLSDFLTNLETIREITTFDQGVIHEMSELKAGVEASRNEAAAYRDEQKEARALVQTKQNSLEAKLSEKKQYITSLESDIKKYEKLEADAEAQEKSLKQRLSASLSRSSGPAPKGGAPIKYSGGIFCWPAPSYSYISSDYGYRIHPITGRRKFHSGVDMASPGGSPILAAADGTVRMASWNGGYGNCVIVDHGNGIQSLYGHCSRILVSAGQSVKKGQKIALVGTTGMSSGNHLHFEVLNNGGSVSPWPYLK